MWRKIIASSARHTQARMLQKTRLEREDKTSRADDALSIAELQSSCAGAHQRGRDRLAWHVGGAHDFRFLLAARVFLSLSHSSSGSSARAP